MARVRNVDGSKKSGKMNKKSKEVHRIINGKEYTHTINKEYVDDPSNAQKLQRAVFGKTNALVNVIMADPVQVQEWSARMEEYNRSIKPYEPPFPQRYETVRQFAYAMLSEQMKQNASIKRRKSKLPVTLPRSIRLYIKAFSDLSNTELYEILKARFSVFVGEQHIHYLDEDNIDYKAIHFSLRRKGLVIAYARLFKDSDKGVLRIGRMLTVERNQGYTKYLMERIAEYAKNQGADKLRLHAQKQVVPVYEHLGFHTVGNIFTEAEIPHIVMERTL